MFLPKRQRENTHTHTGYVKMEGEIGVMSPEAKESQQPPEAQREKERASREPLKGDRPS